MPSQTKVTVVWDELEAMTSALYREKSVNVLWYFYTIQVGRLFLIFSLFLFQNSTISIEEFHAQLQEATNFPLRPFVIPFLKVCFPELF